MKIKKIFLILIISIFLFLTGCSNNEQQDLVSKCNEQINYLDTKLFSMANSLNNIPIYNYKVESREATVQEESTQGSESAGSSGQGSGGGQSESGGSSDNSSTSNQQNTISITQMEPNSILISDENIDWKSAKVDIENLYETWGTIILDLYKLNLDSANILGFSSDLDSATTAIKAEDKVQSLNRNC